MIEISEQQIGYFEFVGIKKRYWGKDIASYHTTNPGQIKALTIVRNFIDSLPERINQGDCLVFCGKPGSGKTHLGISIIHACMERRVSSKYTTVPELIKRIRATYSNNGNTVEQIVKELSELKMLVIDEVGVDAGKEDTTTLFDIIDTRYRHQLPTVIITNLNQEGLTKYIGERVMDRLAEGNGVVVGFDWASFRRK